MTKKHLYWLVIGILAWGSIPSIFLNMYFGFSLKKLLSTTPVFLLITIIVVLMVQYEIGGFSIGAPKRWFFIPLFSLILFLILGIVEATLIGGFDYVN